MNYRAVSPLAEVRPNPEGEQIGLNGGFVGEVTPREAPLSRSPLLDAVRFQGTSVRKDFGYTRMGEPAGSRVLGLHEHKFIRFDSTFFRLVRLSRDNEERMRLEVWVGDEWVFVGTTDEQIADEMISTLSIQGVLLMAEGRHIFIWEETFEPVDVEQNWPAGNLLVNEGDSVNLIVDPNEAVNGDYRVRFRATIKGASLAGVRATIALLHNGVEIATRTLVSQPTEEEDVVEVFDNQIIEFNRRQINRFDILTLRLKNISWDPIEEGIVNRASDLEAVAPTTVRQDLSLGMVTSVRQGTKVREPEAEESTYTFVGIVNADGTPGTMRILYMVDVLGNGDWSVVEIQDFVNPSGSIPLEFAWKNLVAPIGGDARFRIEVSFDPGGASFPILTFTRVEWLEDTYGGGGIGVTVHGYTTEDYEDELPGLEYQAEGPAISVLEVVSPDAPGGRYIFEFAERVVALRDGGDTQSLAWSARGNVRDWTGPGSGQIFLTSSRSDPIDDLMAGAALGSDIGVVFRKRSIWRLFQTGNILQSLGVVPWIEGIGTESPFSVKNVERGVIFLGHNLMVYFLSEEGLQPIGIPIHQELIRTLTSNLDIVDATWDATFNEYILGIPAENSSEINRLWYFDVRRFLDRGELIWRPRTLSVQRLATTGSI